MDLMNRLRLKNKPLYYFGWFNLIFAFGSFLMMQFDDTKILGINAWIKPMKFFLSVGIFSFTMAWFLPLLGQHKKSRIYSYVIILTLTLEVVIISYQSWQGTTSHFNVSSELNGFLFKIMGIAIIILTAWTAYINLLFFRSKNDTVPSPYLWGIRLGMLIFVLFALEGIVMVEMMKHTVGGPDGGRGLFFVNWSRDLGDLRVPHFFGLHALQILPLIGYYVCKTNRQIIIYSILYFLMVAAMLMQALLGIPLL